jgi:hypothetical protein
MSSALASSPATSNRAKGVVAWILVPTASCASCGGTVYLPPELLRVPKMAIADQPVHEGWAGVAEVMLDPADGIEGALVDGPIDAGDVDVGRRTASLALGVHRMRPMSPTVRYPMTSAERLDEVARLLALGFLRLRARRRRGKVNDPNHLREFGLDLGAEGSVCDTDADFQRRGR